MRGVRWVESRTLVAALAGMIVLALAAAVGSAVALYDSGEQAAPATSTVPVPETPTATTTTPTPPTPTQARPSSASSRSRSAATRALCSEMGASIQAVVAGRAIGGGLRLSRAVNNYGDEADPAVVQPVRRMLATALQGDLDASAAAADEATSACTRLGYPVPLPEPGPGPIPCDFPPC